MIVVGSYLLNGSDQIVLIGIEVLKLFRLMFQVYLISSFASIRSSSLGLDSGPCCGWGLRLNENPNWVGQRQL